jgi:16S rRNA C1402 N4-methylase RsmH
MSKHIPVLLKETIQNLTKNFQEKNVFVDCTFGMGSFTKLLLQVYPNSTVYSFDLDLINTKPHVERIKEEFKDRFVFINDNFANITKHKM